MASEGLYRAKWTDLIHDEWTRNLKKDRPDIDPHKIDRTRDLMNRAVLDCMVTGFEDLIPNLELPDPSDRHVLAAAIKCNADGIVTFNRKDFSTEIETQFGVEVQHPDDFLLAQLDLDEPKVITCLRECRSRLKNPPETAGEFLDRLGRQTLPKFVAQLRDWESIL
ncbi:PIN domain-containing protein [Aureimonas altamirensis]|uniref:PIN domain-containing protein n=1 Tax=Aureimonas altamirensis TaxID=370622 RepID=UPI001E5FBDD3|nr:PIN domain-containing protein [Aureimonas altamirensis]UHD47940.1 PIN domain-containing protein [Aureimonas altamirensis]